MAYNNSLDDQSSDFSNMAALRQRRMDGSRGGAMDDSNDEDYIGNQQEYTGFAGQDTTGPDGHLASMEASFSPADQAHPDYARSQKQQGAAAASNVRLPGTPQLVSAARQNSKKNTIRDAAGFVRREGGRGVFERDDTVIEEDPSSTSSRQYHLGDRDQHSGNGPDHSDGALDQPSFERSDSHSMQVEDTRAPSRQSGPVGTTTNIASRERKVSGRSGDNNNNGMTNSKSTSSKQNLTLREQEKVIDDVKKENFSLKLKIYFLEERLAKLAPEQVDLALKEHIDLQVEYQNTRSELKKHKKLLLNAQKALDDLKDDQERFNGTLNRNEAEAQAEIDRLQEELRQEKAKSDAYRLENDRMHEKLEQVVHRAEHSSSLEKEIQDLEKENASLRSQVNAQVTMLSTRNDEKEQLYDEIELLKQDILGLEGELQANQQGRRKSGASEESQERHIADLEDELNAYKDKLSAAMLDLERREKEVEELNHELDQREEEHGQEMAKVTDEWRAALEEVRHDKDHLTDVLEEREQEIKELEGKLDELDALAHDDQTRIEQAVQTAEKKDQEVAALGVEVIGLTEDLQKLGKQIESLEDEIDEKAARITELERELEAADKELEDKQSLHHQVTTALKEKISTSKARHTDLTIQNESLSTEVSFLRGKVEELALKHAELEESRRADERTRQRLEDDKASLERRLRDKDGEHQRALLEHKREKAELENYFNDLLSKKDQLISSVRAELRQASDRLEVREEDLARLNSVLQDLESHNKRADEDHTSSKMSLILEVERINRDLAHYEADLDHARSRLERKDEELRQKDMETATLRASNNDIAAQLALQTQTRLSLSEKLDATSKSLRDAQEDLSNYRERLRSQESQSGNMSRGSSRNAADYRDQLAERNSLLQHVYQTVEKIVGTEKRKSTQELRPHTNFAVFHDGLMSRLRAISQIQLHFERRARDLEARFTDQVSSLRRQAESKLKQVDRCETSVKAALDSQKQWKQRVMLKQGEVESVKATNAELSNQVSALKSQVNISDASPGTSHKIQTLAARASAAEKRLAATQAQLQNVESKYAEAKAKTTDAEENWEGRLRELMNRLRAAEEKVKRERQGAKERVRELEQTVNHLKQEVADANARSDKLSQVLNQQ